MVLGEPAKRTTSVVEDVIGRPAHSFLEWAGYRADDFR
jgi:hypothetical protein